LESEIKRNRYRTKPRWQRDAIFITPAIIVKGLMNFNLSKKLNYLKKAPKKNYKETLNKKLKLKNNIFVPVVIFLLPVLLKQVFIQYKNPIFNGSNIFLACAVGVSLVMLFILGCRIIFIVFAPTFNYIVSVIFLFSILMSGLLMFMPFINSSGYMITHINEITFYYNTTNAFFWVAVSIITFFNYMFYLKHMKIIYNNE
jgi:hypothetical protein